MPRKPRNSPRPPGRPPEVAKVAKVRARVAKTGESIEEAAKRVGVTATTVHNHAARGLAKAKAAPPAAATALPQGGAVSGRPDLLELVRRILDARNPAARTELDEALAVHVAGGEPALAPWLARPIAAVEINRDELDTLREGLGFALAIARTAEAGGPQLRALGIVDRLGKSVSVVAGRRPSDETPDAVTQRLVSIRDAAIERMGIITGEAAAKLAEDRAALFAGLEQEIAPRLLVELRARVDKMLGGAT